MAVGTIGRWMAVIGLVVGIGSASGVSAYDGPDICEIKADKQIDTLIANLASGRRLNDAEIAKVLENLTYFLRQLHTISIAEGRGLQITKRALRTYFDSGYAEEIDPRIFIDEHHTYNSRYMSAQCNLGFIHAILVLSDIEAYAKKCREAGGKGYYCPYRGK